MPSPVSISIRSLPVPRRYVLDPGYVNLWKRGDGTLESEFPRILPKYPNHVRTYLESEEGLEASDLLGIRNMNKLFSHRLGGARSMNGGFLQTHVPGCGCIHVDRLSITQQRTFCSQSRRRQRDHDTPQSPRNPRLCRPCRPRCRRNDIKGLKLAIVKCFIDNVEDEL